MNKFYIITILFSTLLYSEYSVGDQISENHQNLAFDVCYGNYENNQLSLSDFADGNSVFWINLAASW